MQMRLPIPRAERGNPVSSSAMSNGRSWEFTFIDLFAGVGGFHHALAGLGGTCKLAVELDREARAVYAASFPEMHLEQIQADIRSLTRETPDADAAELDEDEIRARVPEHDVLCAGFPCQPFSKSGAQLGVRDKTRGTLFFDVMSIVIARQPRFVILENVRNLAGPRHTETWSTIVESLREAGYRISDEPVVMSPHLLAPWEGGAPQVRDRVFVLAERVTPAVAEDERRVEPLLRREPTPDWDPHRWDVREILGSDAADAYAIRDSERGWLEAWQAFVQMIPDEMLPGFPIWFDAFVTEPDVSAETPKWKADFLVKNAAFYRRHQKLIDAWRKKKWGPLNERVEDFPPSRRKFEWQAGRAQKNRKARDLEGLVAHFRPSGIRVKPPTYVPALVAITQTSVVGPKVSGTEWRRLTPREAAELQGIPFDGFEAARATDKAIYKQLGNAVNVGVVRFVARTLFDSAGLVIGSVLANSEASRTA